MAPGCRDCKATMHLAVGGLAGLKPGQILTSTKVLPTAKKMVVDNRVKYGGVNSKTGLLSSILNKLSRVADNLSNR